jgi:hypothetical protein
LNGVAIFNGNEGRQEHVNRAPDPTAATERTPTAPTETPRSHKSFSKNETEKLLKRQVELLQEQVAQCQVQTQHMSQISDFMGLMLAEMRESNQLRRESIAINKGNTYGATVNTRVHSQ